MLLRSFTYLIVSLLAFLSHLYIQNEQLSLPFWGSRLSNSAVAVFLLSIILSLAYIFIRTQVLYVVALGTISVWLIMNLFMLSYLILSKYGKDGMDEILMLQNCAEAIELFDVNLQNKDLKYFHFGIGPDEELADSLYKNYNITVMHMGCLVNSNLECYNEKVEGYVKKVMRLNKR